ncbi:MAG: hypothetical protein CMM37_06015 [Rhodospirillaceae bacterium]|nr:hypothetical protein [Rhodospirillaceae bacterium]
MSSTSNIAGIVLGVVLFVSAIGWFGYQHYKDTQDDRLPLKVKQKLVKFQNKLPIKLGPNLILERFNLKRNSIELALRNTVHIERRIPKDELTFKTHFMICKWREQYVKRIPITLQFTLMGPDGAELISLDNTLEICSHLPSKLPIQYRS